jgi:hypothetical protein
MKIRKGNPATRADAGRAPNAFICSAAMNGAENILPHRSLQLDFLRRRGLPPLRAELIAGFAFGEARS